MTTKTTTKTLNAAQQKHFARLINTLTVTENKLEKQTALRAAAQEAHDLALGNASSFVNYCAEELGVTLGANGWAFNQGKMAFEQVPQNGTGETE